SGEGSYAEGLTASTAHARLRPFVRQSKQAVTFVIRGAKVAGRAGGDRPWDLTFTDRCCVNRIPHRKLLEPFSPNQRQHSVFSGHFVHIHKLFGAIPSTNSNTYTCPTCQQQLPSTSFSPDGSKASGHRSYCRACDSKRRRRYYQGYRNERLAYDR